jgi:GalNAc-alpha-(1->4)-GalNAc-alpha-(1->3)-diNAcBac-PP-undecaprenol alpha-1,4-N-acetyl-D-galactosaminyltransferase
LKNKKIVGIVLPYLKSRGTERQALVIGEGFVNEGFGVILLVYQGWGLDHMYTSFKSKGIKVINVGRPIGVGKKSISYLRILSLISKIISLRCDILISRAAMTNRVTGIAGFLTYRPVVSVLSTAVSSKDIQKTIFLGYFYSIREYFKLGFPQKIVTVSIEGAERFKLSYPLVQSKVLAIQNGIEKASCTKKYEKKTSIKNPLKFCYVGSIDINRKGLDILIKAFSLLLKKDQFCNARLVIIGSGQDEDLMMKKVINEGLSEHVDLVGEVTDPLKYMQKTDVFILPSRREGLPNALLEAMSIGMPVIASNCDTGPREVITSDLDGILVETENVQSLMLAMSKLLTDHSLRAKLGKSAIQTIEKKHSMKLMQLEYINLIKNYLG